ncbi:molybdenum cofactor sulfurase isoform X2 [Pleurodeles waltl]|uniref:molybdenum cofactor sulfurase isoform X2 n=1 Tax=Pleurodeles waltl TaxID=8319 RepID=UPI003709610A
MEGPQHRFSNVTKTWDKLLSFSYFQELPHARGYGYGGNIKEIREKEFSRLGDITYLDHAGTTLFPKSQVENFLNDLTGNVYGNPHSQNISSKLTHDTIEHVRNRVLQHFNTTAEHYTVIFTSGSTEAIKLVAETFPWTPADSGEPGSCLCYLSDNHTSVVGMRMITAAKRVVSVAMKPEEILLKSQAPPEKTACSTSHLFCYPAQSNFSGAKYPFTWIEKIKLGNLRPVSVPGKWYVLLDAASYVSTSFLDLAAHQADFVPVSFYKIFGFPTGLGALLVSNKTAPFMQKRYFGGGTVAAYLAEEDFFVPKQSISERFEDGTTSFLDIIALKHGFDELQRLTGGMKNIQEHTFALACYTFSVLSTLRYANGAPVVQMYSKAEFKNADMQGPIINFNMLDENGDIIGYSQVDKLASLNRIHVRTGCFCNTGACQLHLGISNEDVKKNFKAGHVCGDGVDVIDGRPTGSIRISFGYMSTFEDAQTFLKFIIDTFAKCPSQLDMKAVYLRTPEKVITDSMQFEPLTDEAYNDTLKETKLKHEPITSKNGLSDYVLNDRKKHNEQLEPRSAKNSNVDVLGTAMKDEDMSITLTHIFLYPIKSCAALEVSGWPVGKQGLLYDRNWMIVNQNGVCLSQKQEPKLCLIYPSIDLAQGIMLIQAEGMEPIGIPLNHENDTLNHTHQSRVCGDRVQTYDCGNRIADWLSFFLGRHCRLIRQNSDCLRNGNNKEKKGQPGAALSLVNEAQYLLINTASILHLREKISSRNRAGLEERFPLEDLIPRFRANLVIGGRRAFEEEEWSAVSVGALQFQVLKKCSRCQIICIDQQTGERSNELLQVLASCKGGKTTFGMYLQNRELASSLSTVLPVGSKVVPVLKKDEEIASALSTDLKMLD